MFTCLFGCESVPARSLRPRVCFPIQYRRAVSCTTCPNRKWYNWFSALVLSASNAMEENNAFISTVRRGFKINDGGQVAGARPSISWNRSRRRVDYAGLISSTCWFCRVCLSTRHDLSTCPSDVCQKNFLRKYFRNVCLTVK